MKKWFLIAISIILIFLLGAGAVTLHGHGARNYTACVRQGRFDVIDRNYHDALNYFQGARKVDPEGFKANHDLDQTQSYVNGNRYLNHDKLSLATKAYRRSVRIGSIAALNRRSRIKNDNVDRIMDSTSHFTRWYDQALVLNHRRDFKASVRHLKLILKAPSVKLPYFRNFRKRVTKLMKADHHDSRSKQVVTVVDRSSVNSSFKLRAPKKVKGHPNRLTVAHARHEVRRAGINVNEMSNGDVANLIRQARQHHASVYRYAKKNY